MAYFVSSALKVLYPFGADNDQVRLLYTDATAYTDKAPLKVFQVKLSKGGVQKGGGREQGETHAPATCDHLKQQPQQRTRPADAPRVAPR